MTNRSTFPTAIDVFTEYAELSSSDKTNADRYQTLVMQATRTTAEDTELTNLKTTLVNKIISSESINKMNDCITNLEDYFLNRIMADLATLDVGVLRNDLGLPDNLITADKTNLVSAINEVQTETNNANNGVSSLTTNIGNLTNLTTAQKTSLVLALNEIDSLIELHIASKSNPHNVTATQVGAYSKGEADNLFMKKAQEAWKTASLQNSAYHITDGDDGGATYWKDDMDEVRGRAIIGTPTATLGTVLWNFPVGYRPARNEWITGYYGSSNVYDPILLAITPAGDFKIFENGGVNGGTLRIPSFSFRTV